MNANSQACEKFVLLLDAYHDDALTQNERVSVDEHLRQCPACAEKLAGVSRLVATLKTMPPVQMREDFADKFEARLLAQDTADGKRSKVVVGRFGLAVASAAAFILCICVGQFALNHHSSPAQVQVAAVSTPPVNQVSKTLQAEELASVPSKDDRLPAVSPNARDTDDEQRTAPSEKQSAPVEPVRKRNNLAGARTVVATNSGEPVRSATAGGVPTAPKHSLVAFYEPETNSIPEELGISTDEDGLYAIKM